VAGPRIAPANCPRACPYCSLSGRICLLSCGAKPEKNLTISRSWVWNPIGKSPKYDEEPFECRKKVCPRWDKLPQNSHFQPQLRCEKPKVFYVFARVQIPSAPPSSPAGFPQFRRIARKTRVCARFAILMDSENVPGRANRQNSANPIRARFC